MAIKVGFDIDGTLYKIRPDYRDQVPNYDLIQVLRWFVANGDDVYVWSAGGTEYAWAIVSRLGLEEGITVCSKSKVHEMDLTFDDQQVSLGKVNILVKQDYESE